MYCCSLSSSMSTKFQRLDLMRVFAGHIATGLVALNSISRLCIRKSNVGSQGLKIGPGGPCTLWRLCRTIFLP